MKAQKQALASHAPATVLAPSRRARRTPARNDSKARYERIVNAAVQLLDDIALSDLSMNAIAEAAKISRTSIYDFFPTPIAVLEEVARRHVMHSWYWIREEISRRKPRGLKSVIEAFVDCAALYFNAHPAARKTLVGTGALELYAIDNDYDTLAARMYREFITPDWRVEPYSNEDPFRTLAHLQMAIYTMSVRRHGLITDEMVRECKMMSRAYISAAAKRVRNA